MNELEPGRDLVKDKPRAPYRGQQAPPDDSVECNPRRAAGKSQIAQELYETTGPRQLVEADIFTK
jgi:hypothetical protein